MVNQVLIVDDEPSILDICEQVLKKAGFKVFTALNPLTALEILNRENVGLIITDLKMPVMDGLTFCQKVKTQWPEKAVILMTGYWMSNQEEIEKNKKYLYAFLRKPFDFSELIDLTNKFFNEKNR